MKVIEKETKTTTRDFGGLCKLTFIALAVFALVMLPYRVDLNKGSLKAIVLLADDSGSDGDHDSDSLRLADRRVRLIGLDAPELAQVCMARNNFV